MHEVTKGVVVPVVDHVRERGFPCTGLFEGMAFDEVTFRAHPRRLDWDQFALVYDRLAAEVGGPDRLGDLIAEMRTPTILWMLRTFSRPEPMLRMWAMLSPALFGVLEMRIERSGPADLRVDMSIPTDSAPSHSYFAACGRVLRAWVDRIDPGSEVQVVTMGAHGAAWRVLERGAGPSPDEGPGAPLDLFAELSGIGADLRETATELSGTRTRIERIGRTLARLQQIGPRLPQRCDAEASALVAGLLAEVPGLRGLRATRANGGSIPEPCFEAGSGEEGWQGCDVVHGGQVVGRVEASPPLLHGLDVAAALAPWLALAWQPDGGLPAPGRAGALFLVRKDGALQWTNRAARAWLEGTERGERRLHEATAGGDTLFDVHPIGDPPEHYVVALLDDEAALTERVLAAAGTWSLTPTQREVLEALVRGLTNKEIAAELGNAEATVESHVTRILRKAGVTGRTALVSRVWAGRWR